MSFLRRISTRHLILLCAAVVAVIAGGTALAVAAGAGGSKPPPKSLSVAIHDAVTAPAPQGVTADVTFTNHLIDAATLEGSDPLLSGATGRLWATPDGHFRVELQGTSGHPDAQVVYDGTSFWAYEPSSNTVYRGSVPQHKDSAGASEQHQPPTLQKIEQALAKLGTHATVSGAQPDNVGGQQAYDVRVSPKQSGGLLGGAALAWDAAHGVPLRIGLYARGQSAPVVELSVTNISFGTIASDALTVSPPAGAKTVDLTTSQNNAADQRKKDGKPVTGLSAVQAALPFKVAAPGALAGRQRQEVKLLGHDRALVTYGQGLGGIAVIEQAAKSTPAANSTGGGGDHRQGLNLPSVSIAGAPGQELATPLGTVVQFQRAGVEYTVLGSVKPAAALSAARGL
jgi:outer membrane lipoprotein-sorting protein